MSYVLKVTIQQIECLPAQSTNQLHIQVQPHPHFQWLRHSVAVPLSEHATNRKKKPVLVLQRNPMQTDKPDSSCKWLCALARSHSIWMLLQFFYLQHELVQLGLWHVTASVCCTGCSFQLGCQTLEALQCRKNLACAIHYSISFVNHFYCLLVSVSSRLKGYLNPEKSVSATKVTMASFERRF